jgi:hypothetical protein
MSKIAEVSECLIGPVCGVSTQAFFHFAIPTSANSVTRNQKKQCTPLTKTLFSDNTPYTSSL